MKAAYIDRPATPRHIRYADLPMPVMGERDVLVQVLAVAVNGIDTYIVNGQFETPLPLPFIIGRDLTGVVARVGTRVGRFRQGELVWANNQGYAGRQGSFAEYCSVDERLLYPLPANADPFEMVSVLHSGLTAVLGLQKAQLRPGEVVFLNGGDGNVGSAILQLAKAMGARVVVTSADEGKAEWCRQLGADLVIDYTQQAIEQALADFSPRGVDIYWEITRHFDARLALTVLARRGRMLVIAGLTQETLFPVGPFYTRNATLYGFTISDATTDELRQSAEEINQRVASGALKGRVAQKLPLSQAALAYDIFESTSPPGKLVLSPQWEK
jgi:NADPH:quinone reductase